MRYTLLLLVFLTSFSASASAASQTILVLGDSLSAAYNMPKEQGWVNLLSERLQTELPEQTFEVVNASISGDTTYGGLSRLPQALQTHQPAIVIIELGANDGLRGLPLKQLRSNLSQLAALAQQSGAQVMLAGMRLPTNYGKVFTERFHQVYIDVGQQENITLIPFFLQGVGGVAEMIQADGLHPNAKAQPIILDNVWPHLEPLLTDS